MAQSNVDPASFNTRIAARYLGVSVSTLDKSRTSGELLSVEAPPYIRLGKSVRYLRSDLDAWLTQAPKFKHQAEEHIHKNERSTV